MKSMFTLCLMLSLASPLLFAAPAVPVVIEDQKCVATAYSRVRGAVVDYPVYAQLPEATLYFFGITMLKMIKSEETLRVPGDASDAIVYIEMRPLNFTDAKRKFYPRFYTRCRLADISSTASDHACHWLAPSDSADYGQSEVPRSFGLSGFSSRLHVEQGADGCKPNQTSLKYRVVIEPNLEDIDAMVRAWGVAGKLPLPVDRFFLAYYKNFYDGWIKRVASL
jgi:hypothetical protein